MTQVSTQKPKATRQAFGEMLAELGEKFPKIVVLDADLSKSTKSELFAKKFPERFFEMGIAEANMIGTAAGLAFSGLTPFLCSFGCFVTGRYDQIRLSVAYSQAYVRIIGTHAGVGIGDDGHSQMGLEDVNLMRGLPTMVVLQPCDEEETRQMVELLARPAREGGLEAPVYLRLTRQNLPSYHGKDYKFRLGKLDVLKKSTSGAKKRVCLFATGATVAESMVAAELLETEGLGVDVVNVPTLKPFDEEGFLNLISLGSYESIYAVEDHSVIGGLGTVLAESLAGRGSKKAALPPLVRIGVQDEFGESGEAFELYEKFGLSAKQIVKRVKAQE